MSLGLNIVANDFSSYFISYTPDKVSIIPRLSSSKLFLQLGIFFEYLSRRYTLHYLHYLGWSLFRWHFGKYVHMVFHYFHGVYLKTILFGNMLEHFFQISHDFFRKYPLTVFGIHNR
jgi:hypothetical protein